MELKTGLLFETKEGKKFEMMEYTEEYVLLQRLTDKGEYDTKKVKYNNDTFIGLIRNKTFSKTCDRKRSFDTDIYEALTDSDVNLRDMSK